MQRDDYTLVGISPSLSTSGSSAWDALFSAMAAASFSGDFFSAAFPRKDLFSHASGHREKIHVSESQLQVSPAKARNA